MKVYSNNDERQTVSALLSQNKMKKIDDGVVVWFQSGGAQWREFEEIVVCVPASHFLNTPYQEFRN